MKKHTKEQTIKLYNDVRDFESKADRKYRLKELADIFGVSWQTISRIRAGTEIKPYKYGVRDFKLIDPYSKLRDSVLDLYNRKCNKCGFSDIRALQIDHINGGGNKEQREKKSYGVYKNALSHPEQYQLLCANCNWIKRHTGKEVKPAMSRKKIT